MSNLGFLYAHTASYLLLRKLGCLHGYMIELKGLERQPLHEGGLPLKLCSIDHQVPIRLFCKGIILEHGLPFSSLPPSFFLSFLFLFLFVFIYVEEYQSSTVINPRNISMNTKSNQTKHIPSSSDIHSNLIDNHM